MTRGVLQVLGKASSDHPGWSFLLVNCLSLKIRGHLPAVSGTPCFTLKSSSLAVA